ncbi:MAG: hypothetical protein V1736_07110 [Pseudomonadota bacterium]
MVKRFTIFVLMPWMLIACGTINIEERQQAAEGIAFSTGKERGAVMDTIARVMIAEGYILDQSNEKYGIIACKPYFIPTGDLLMKIGEPGGSFANSIGFQSVIEFNAIVSEDGDVRIKTAAFLNINRNAMDMALSVKLNNYYSGIIHKALEN